jgi:hypothetical protein
MSTRTRTAGGQEINQKIRTDFIVAGQTTRAEVLEKLKAFDSGTESNRFLLARWSSSKMASFYALCGYLSCAAVGAQRNWKIANALVEFDKKDFVTRYDLFGDRSLVRRLSVLAARDTTVDFEVPRELHVEHLGVSEHPATLILGKDTFDVRESGKSTHNFQVNSTSVVEIRAKGFGPLSGAQLSGTPVAIQFKEKTKVGKSMTVRIGVPDLFLLLEYCNQHH